MIAVTDGARAALHRLLGDREPDGKAIRILIDDYT